MCDEFRESLAPLPCCSKPWIWISEPNESRVKKFIRGRSLPKRALSVKGPAKNQLPNEYKSERTSTLVSSISQDCVEGLEADAHRASTQFYRRAVGMENDLVMVKAPRRLFR